MNKEKNYAGHTAVSYSNDLKPEILEIHKKYKISSFQKMKSSLKFCVIAAGHAILDHSGGKVTDFNYNEILYGKTEFKNPSLILKSKNVL